ncbi:MAG: glycosyltransferase N-terminal domain-containing protein, partial [Desulforhabdus sp.]|nr:glycosyltransferase N-terminal domain-containing protein [Desulforhabdus sp.]
MIQRAYNLCLNTAGRGLLPLMMSKARHDVRFSSGRFGNYSEPITRQGRPRVWFHAASVGEVGGAIPIMHSLHNRLQHSSVFLTVATPQGFHFARKQLPNWAQVLPFPLDFTESMERAFDQLQPDIYVALESEFWPNLYGFLECRGVPAILLNGRLSRRSAKIYGLMRPLFRPIFERFQWLAMHSEEDLRNVLTLGARPERTLVLGSSKYEGLLTRIQPEKPEQWRKILQMPPGTPVVVGGSLRRSECIELLEIYGRLQRIEPRLTAILAPRHLEQLLTMANWLTSKRMPFQYLSRIENNLEKRDAAIVLVDRIGVLFELYALGDLIFCG